MSEVGAVVRARMESSRLPGKTMLEAAGKTMLEHVLERLGAAGSIDRVAVATTTDAVDDEIAAACDRLGVGCFRGSADDVLGRVLGCAEELDVDHVAHFGADNPLIDPELCDRVISVYLEADGELDYVTNNRPPTFPDGEEVEVTSRELLRTMDREARERRFREHILLWAWENPGRVRMRNIDRRPSLHHERWTLDHPEDLELLRAVFDGLYGANPTFGIGEVLEFLDAHPELRELNARHRDDYAWLESGTPR